MRVRSSWWMHSRSVPGPLLANHFLRSAVQQFAQFGVQPNLSTHNLPSSHPHKDSTYGPIYTVFHSSEMILNRSSVFVYIIE